MTAIEQYLIDTYRAAQQGAPMPPQPGSHDLATLRSLRTTAQFDAVLAGHPATHPWRHALTTALTRLRHRGHHPHRPAGGRC